jgi:hypothetical protein
MNYYVIRHKETGQLFPVAKNSSWCDVINWSSYKSPRLFTRINTVRGFLTTYCKGAKERLPTTLVCTFNPNYSRRHEDFEIVEVRLTELEVLK